MIAQSLVFLVLPLLACMSIMATSPVVIDNPIAMDAEHRAKSECWKLIQACKEKVDGREIAVQWGTRNVTISVHGNQCRIVDLKEQLTSADAAKLLKALRKQWACGDNLPELEAKVVEVDKPLVEVDKSVVEVLREAERVGEDGKPEHPFETVVVPAAQATPKPKKSHRVELVLTIKDKRCSCKPQGE